MVAVAVNDDLFVELRRLIVGGVLDEELAEEEGLVAEFGGAGIVGEEVGEFVAEDGGAAWFEDDDGCAGGELRSECVESFEEILFCGVEHAEVVKRTATAEVTIGQCDAEAGGGEDLMGGAHGGGVEVVVEGVGPEEDVGCVGGERGATVATALRITGEAAVGSEGLGEAGEGALRVDVEDFFDERADDGRVVDGIDEMRREGGDAGEDIDAAEGVVGEGTGVVLVVVGEELGFVSGHVDGDGALGLAGFAGEAEVEGLFDLFIFPLVGEDFALH